MITCIILKKKEDIKNMAPHERESYFNHLKNEYYIHSKGIQENPFTPKELKKVSSKHMGKVLDLMNWINKPAVKSIAR